MPVLDLNILQRPHGGKVCMLHCTSSQHQTKLGRKLMPCVAQLYMYASEMNLCTLCACIRISNYTTANITADYATVV